MVIPDLHGHLQAARRQEEAARMLKDSLMGALTNPHTQKRHKIYAKAIGNEADHKIVLLGLPDGSRLEIVISADEVASWIKELSEPLGG